MVVLILFRSETHCVLRCLARSSNATAWLPLRGQSERKALRRHPTGMVVLILFRSETHCVLRLRRHPTGKVVLKWRPGRFAPFVLLPTRRNSHTSNVIGGAFPWRRRLFWPVRSLIR